MFYAHAGISTMWRAHVYTHVYTHVHTHAGYLHGPGAHSRRGTVRRAGIRARDVRATQRGLYAQVYAHVYVHVYMLA